MTAIITQAQFREDYPLSAGYLLSSRGIEFIASEIRDHFDKYIGGEEGETYEEFHGDVVVVAERKIDVTVMDGGDIYMGEWERTHEESEPKYTIEAYCDDARFLYLEKVIGAQLN